jgi:hypothetical protein
MSNVNAVTPQDDKNLEMLITIWEKTIDVQMHFNDIQLRIRNFSILLLSAFVGGIGVTMKEHYQVDVHGSHVPLTAIIFFAGALIWAAFYFMDRYWYHPLLLGAVAHGLNIEELMEARFKVRGLTGVNAKNEPVEAAALTKTIGKKSPVKVLGFITLRSSNKEHVFYGSIFLVLIAMGVLVMSSTTGASEPNTGRLGEAVNGAAQTNTGSSSTSNPGTGITPDTKQVSPPEMSTRPASGTPSAPSH